MRTRNITIAAVAALSLLTACSSDSEGAADTTAAGSDTTASDTVKASGEHASEEFCTFQEDMNNADSPLNSADAPTPEALEAFITDTIRPSIEKLTATAPDEMAEDAATMAEAYGKLSDLFEKNGWDITKALADPDSAALNNQDYSDASKRIDEYCGFTPSN